MDGDFMLEALLNREGWAEPAETLWEMMESGPIQGYITEFGLDKIFAYVSRLSNSEIAEEVILDIQEIVKVCPVSRSILQTARSSNIIDFESAVEVACATVILHDVVAIVTQCPQNFAGADFSSVLSVDELTISLEPDYSRLRELLAERQWQEADRETGRVMLQICAEREEGWLDEERINKFPYHHLCDIDNLWVDASQGRYGFSVQARILMEVNMRILMEVNMEIKGQPQLSEVFDRNVWSSFVQRVGWSENQTWSNLIFDGTAPDGHLPVAGGASRWGLGLVWGAEGFALLLRMARGW